MSPFLVYLMFQMGSINSMLIAFGVALCIASVLLCFGAVLTEDYSWTNHELQDARKSMCRKWARRTIPSAVALILISALLPSTKTIAAMIVLPKITSPQAMDTMGKESRDIYELAKKALANLADDKPAASDKK